MRIETDMDLKKCTAINPTVSARKPSKKLSNLFFQKNWHRTEVWPKLKCTGAMAAAETKPKYIICAKCGQTAWASFAPATS